MCVGGGGGGGGLTCGVIVVRMYEPVFQYTPFICLIFEKPFDYLIVRNVDLFIYCPLFFCTHLLLVVRQILQSMYWIPRQQAASKNLWAKNMCIGMSEKLGLSHRNQEKLGHSYTFSWKKGANHIPGSAENGRPFGTHIRTMPYIGSSRGWGVGGGGGSNFLYMA